MFEFENLELQDVQDKSMFANAVCKLIYQKHNGNLNECMGEVKSIYSYFFEYVHNIYECVEIPLFALYEMNEYGAKNYGLSESQFEEVKERVQSACIKYYS